GYALPPETILATVDYYLPRTSHGSTLGRVVDAWILARSDRRRSWSSFNEALAADVAETQGGTTAEGIHLGAMAGTLDIVQRCYGGVQIHQDQVVIRPWLPEGIRGVHFPIYYRSHRLDVRITPDRVRIKLGRDGSGLVTVRI